ncbi:uncharacterized protein LOC143184880 [Calliopsis andreniformis]|uniref:uncharacterized protein LOC143184880 n=1 Tax=Calliopsis andreniformis TaxID=337506 RepID=UPI003FCE91BF
MVLIIRNNRILSSRQSRIKRFFSYVHKDHSKSSEKEYPQEQSKDPSTMSLASVLGTLFLYSVAMFTLPFVAFFGVQHLMKTQLHVDRYVTNCCSVLAAVVTVNIIISCYAYHALHESDDTSDSDEVADQPSKESLNKKID